MSEHIVKVERLYAAHTQVICDNELEKWPDLYTEECVYRLISRVNYERNLPTCIILAESRGALVDRVTAIRNTLVYAPRYITHLVTNVCIVKEDGNLLQTRSQFAVYFTQTDGNPRIQLVGRTFDKIDTSQSEWRFAARDVVFDNELVPGSIVHPI